MQESPLPSTVPVAGASAAVLPLWSRRHIAQFYQDDAFIHDAIARYLDDGLRAGRALLVLATPERWQAVAARLRAAGHDLDRLALDGTITVADANEAIERIVIDGVPDPVRFRDFLHAAIAPAGGRPLCAYGQFVDMLCGTGRHAAAIRLEELWNEFGTMHELTLLCAYRLDYFRTAADRGAFEQVCSCHGTIVPCESYDDDESEAWRAREITMLQQRAHAVEAELERRTALEHALRQAIAEHQRVEQELRVARDEAERANRVKSEFLAIMSHELRTPLNAIVGYRDLLAMEIGGTLSPEQKRFVERIHTASAQLLELIDQVLSVSRLEAGSVDLHTQIVDVVAIARDACSYVEPLARERGLLVRQDAPVAAHCETDPGKLRQILLNLLSNAVKFTAHGTIDVLVRDDADGVTIAVRDTGVGIAEADQRRIFDRFVQVDNSLTRRYEGTGLGLSVCRDLARLLGADLRLQSRTGVGSVFTLRLPRSPLVPHAPVTLGIDG